MECTKACLEVRDKVMGSIRWTMGMFDIIFFFKQKTAYEMRISDWSSDVCSSDLAGARIESRHRIPEEGWPDRRSRIPWLQHRRLRLHDLHRQFGPAQRADQQGHW